MRPIQGSDSVSRTAVVDQPTYSQDVQSPKQTGESSVPTNSAAEKKSATQIAEQNKAAKELEATMRQHDLQNHVASGGIFLAPGKPNPSTPKGKLIHAEDGIAIFKNGKNHTVYGENKDLIPGKPKDGVNGVYVEDKNGKPHVFIFDKNGTDRVGHFEPNKFTPQQIVKIWEEERAKNPKASSAEINDAVLKRKPKD